MSKIPLDIKEGRVFNYLTIIKEVERTEKTKRRFLCRCECGNLKEVNLTHLRADKIKSCGCSTFRWHRLHSGDKNPNWKGGRRKETGGYIEVYLPTHPKARQNGYIKEHRLVMEKHLGRLLLDCENVHHINGDKSNNNISNLELWNVSQPSGQRIPDKIKWAKEILKLYKDYK